MGIETWEENCRFLGKAIINVPNEITEEWVATLGPMAAPMTDLVIEIANNTTILKAIRKERCP